MVHDCEFYLEISASQQVDHFPEHFMDFGSNKVVSITQTRKDRYVCYGAV